METATLLTAARILGAVEGLTQAKIDAADLAKCERGLFEVALDAAVAPLPLNSWASPGHYQTKFYTICLDTETRSSLTVFAHETPR
jgi:hypothetical protein